MGGAFIKGGAIEPCCGACYRYEVAIGPVPVVQNTSGGVQVAGGDVRLV